MAAAAPTAVTEDHTSYRDTMGDVTGVMELVEEVDMDTFRLIRDHFDVVYERLGEEFWVFDSATHSYRPTDKKQAETLVNEMYRSKLNSTKVKYHYSSKMTSGRRFSSHSLQGISRKLRHTLAKDIYYDLDIVNAHPTFLLQLCRSLEFDHPILEQYVTHRDPLLEKWIGTTIPGSKYTKGQEPKQPDPHPNVLTTRDEVKAYFLRVLNGGGYEKTSCKDLNDFYERQQILLTTFYHLPQYKRFRDRVYNKTRTDAVPSSDKKDNKKSLNAKGSALNYYLCEVENIVLSRMERFLQEHGMEYGVLCFDGLMVYIIGVKKAGYTVDQLVKEMSAFVTEQMGYPITIKHKVMDEGLDLSDLRPKKDIETTDEVYAKVFMNEIKDDFKYDSYLGEFWFFDEEQALWKQQPIKHIRKHITKYLTPYIMTSPDKKFIEEECKRIQSDGFQSMLVRMCDVYIVDHNDERFIQSHFDCMTGLIPIADKKVIELSTGVIRDRKKTDYFTKTTQRRIVPLSEEIRTEMLQYYSDMLKTTSITHRDSLLSRMAYVLTGENNQKVILLFIGEKNGGKSTFLDHHHKMLEGFACWGSDRVFLKQKNPSCHDSEMFSLIGRRMVSVSEQSKTDTFNCVRMKMMSGGDSIDIRGAGDKRTINVKFNCIITLATNQTPFYDDPAFADRLNCFHFCNVFKKDSSVLTRLEELRDHYFTLLTEYAKSFYDKGKILEPCEELTTFSQKIHDSHDSVKVWCSLQPIVKGEKKDFVENIRLFEEYNTYCEGYKIKQRDGREIFYKKFEEFFEVEKAVQIKYKIGEVEHKIRGYRGLKRIEDEEEKDN